MRFSYVCCHVLVVLQIFTSRSWFAWGHPFHAFNLPAPSSSSFASFVLVTCWPCLQFRISRQVSLEVLPLDPLDECMSNFILCIWCQICNQSRGEGRGISRHCCRLESTYTSQWDAQTGSHSYCYSEGNACILSASFESLDSLKSHYFSSILIHLQLIFEDLFFWIH